MRPWRASFAFTAITLAAFSGCVPPGSAPQPTNGNQPANTNQPVADQKPSIEVSPTKDDAGNWKVADADTVTVAVSAPGAEMVKLLYRPTFADENEYARLKSVRAADKATGKFTTDLKLPSDFAGDVWAEASYANGQTKESDPIALRRASPATENLPDATAPKASPDVSARSDSVTGGKIERAPIAKGNPDLRITINIPAFQLTLWQGDKEIETYPIGIGQKKYPLPSGNRVARELILNPDWVPPDVEWVRKENVEPGEPIEAGNPKNPLGDFKIPIGGEGILIHEARKVSDLGNLVSHGCARLTEKDFLDFIEKIAVAQELPLTVDEIRKIMATDQRKDIAFKKPIPVDISYDTAVVEGGTLHLYPDVYDKGTATVENVRQELAESGVDSAQVDDQTLAEMLKRVDRSKAFVVAVSDVKAGKALQAGKTEPIVARTATPPAGGKPGRAAKGRRS
jgi:lipoprotein-anchoring transpeptidase ErfK/SrfK